MYSLHVLERIHFYVGENVDVLHKNVHIDWPLNMAPTIIL